MMKVYGEKDDDRGTKTEREGHREGDVEKKKRTHIDQVNYSYYSSE